MQLVKKKGAFCNAPLAHLLYKSGLPAVVVEETAAAAPVMREKPGGVPATRGPAVTAITHFDLFATHADNRCMRDDLL